MSALKTLYSGQLTKSTQLIKKSSCNASFWHLHVLMGESIIIQLMGIISYDIVGLKGNGAKENKRLNFASVVYSLSNVIIEYSLLIF